MDLHQNRYSAIIEAASQAVRELNFRIAADRYLEAFHLAPRGVWTKEQFFCFSSYLALLDSFEIVTDRDYVDLHQIAIDSNEQHFVRARAFQILGQLHADKTRDLETAADCLRHCVALCDTTGPEERQHVDNYYERDHPTVDIVRTESLQRIHRWEDLEIQEEEYDRNLHVMDPVRAAWGIYERGDVVPVLGDMPTEQLERRLAVGGRSCDCCGATRDSLDSKCLLVCARCNMAYYCSKECQKTQWRERGHKVACRKKDEFLSGDVVRCYRRNGTNAVVLDKLVQPARVSTDDGDTIWLVESFDNTAYEQRRQSGMYHIRPKDVNCGWQVKEDGEVKVQKLAFTTHNFCTPRTSLL